MTELRSETKVGLLILAALAAVALGIIMIGDQNNLFQKKVRYYIEYPNVSGLNEGNPVQLNGVNCGQVEKIILPTAVEAAGLKVWINLDEKWSQRIRQDSVARIQTLGLLGDKYIQITTGSPDQPIIEPGQEIPSEGTDIQRLMATGEGLANNVVHISSSLKRILDRVDQGEGLIGELTSNPETGRKVTESLMETLDSIQALTHQLETGSGPLARLINDEALGNEFAGAIGRIDGLLETAENGEGLVAGLLTDPEPRARVDSILTDLEATSERIASITAKLDGGADQVGILPKLMNDEAFSAEIEELIHHLKDVSLKLSDGEGTAGQLINDPAIHDALQDIVVGIDESKLLRWLIRNRQKKGIETRYEEEQDSSQP